MVNAIAMSVMLIVALTTFVYLMIPRVRLLGQARADQRFDRYGERLRGVLKFAVGQWRMPRDPIAGVAHIFIFSGFMVVSLATIDHFLHAYGAHFPGLGPGPLRDGYVFVKDVFELLVLVGVGYGLWRRLKPAPSRVGRSREGVFVLAMILYLMASDFCIAGGRLAAAGIRGLPWDPAGHGVSLVLGLFGPDLATWTGEVAYWTHCAAILIFLNFLPIGKHFHVITGIPRVFFRNLKPYGQVDKVDLENSETFGLRSTADLSWSMVLDLYACTECGRCTVYCPTVLTGKPLAHRQLNLDLKKFLYEDGDVLRGADASQKEALLPLVGERISADTIWACTTCGSCEQECPVFIENVPRIIEMRQHKVLMEGDIAPELARAYKGMENNNNPWGLGFDKRDAWAEGQDVPRMADVAGEGSEAPLLYWIGCAGSFDDRNKKITLAMVKILQAAGVPFAILGKEEGCTGDPARRTGNEYLFQTLATANVEILNRYNVTRVLTHCPHCLHTIKSEYPQFGGNYEVIHHTELLDNLISSGKLQLTAEVRETIALHDSCYLGRYHGIYDAPRNVIRAVPGATLRELPRNKSRSVCCGAGGGRFWVEETIGERINVHRAKEAAQADSNSVCSACPFCLTMMKDGMAQLGRDDIDTQDVAEVVARAL